MTPWTRRAYGPPIPVGWGRERDPDWLHQPCVRYYVLATRRLSPREVIAYADGVTAQGLWCGPDLVALRALLDCAAWDHDRLAGGEEP